MASTLKGERELRARLNAIKEVSKPILRKWGKSDVGLMRVQVPVKTERLRRSFRVTSTSRTKVRVGGHYTAYFVDAGPKPHDITAKHHPSLVFQEKGRTIFARKVHSRGYAARPFRVRAARQALIDNPQATELITLWNKAA